MSANMFVGAKHDRSQYGIITNNLYAVMLRPLQKPDTPYQISNRLRCPELLTVNSQLLVSCY
jgi:hypothetical protein